MIKVRTRESARAGSVMMDDLDPEKNTQEISVSWPACFYMEREGAYGFRVVAASATHDRRPPIAVQCKSQPLLHYLVIYWPVTHDTTLILGQGGAGIRIPDRTPVGWLPLRARKKKMDIVKSLPSEAHLSTNDNASSIIYYMGL